MQRKHSVTPTLALLIFEYLWLTPRCSSAFGFWWGFFCVFGAAEPGQSAPAMTCQRAAAWPQFVNVGRRSRLSAAEVRVTGTAAAPKSDYDEGKYFSLFLCDTTGSWQA